ncbi:Acetyltransferase, ribosomal protein N-acetylase [Frankia sp. AiPs1]|uniref:GNAT family N-acetyltransferase n=1 Tax=Frankia sp. AiPa1 TaxID=573492 RepID=UPI00202B5072|nr:GNAT family N-acetyltransferase [Frankia sp. AiPa1]MCL9760388.1 GNAT family N-acetyltransferase [Frankia sp. AiPa1]
MPSLEPAEITAGRLHLRPWRPYDVDAVHLACQDPQIALWNRLPQPYQRADAESFVLRAAPAAWAEGTGTPFAVVDATTEQLLASIALIDISVSGEAEIGYWCAAQARGQGVISQAVTTVTRWGFGALGLARIEWRAAVGNDASLRVAQRTGFTVEGTLRQALILGDGRRVDCWIGSRLPTDPPPTALPPREPR